MPQHSPQPTLAGWSAVNSTTPSGPGKTVNCGSEESGEISKKKVPRAERPVRVTAGQPGRGVNPPAHTKASMGRAPERLHNGGLGAASIESLVWRSASPMIN